MGRNRRRRSGPRWSPAGVRWRSSSHWWCPNRTAPRRAAARPPAPARRTGSPRTCNRPRPRCRAGPWPTSGRQRPAAWPAPGCCGTSRPPPALGVRVRSPAAPCRRRTRAGWSRCRPRTARRDGWSSCARAPAAHRSARRGGRPPARWARSRWCRATGTGWPAAIWPAPPAGRPCGGCLGSPRHQ